MKIVAITLHEDVCTFMKIFRQILLRKRNVSDKICRENSKHTLYIQLIFPENRNFYEIMCESMVAPSRSRMAI
jgi:hypothetical protein